MWHNKLILCSYQNASGHAEVLLPPARQRFDLCDCQTRGHNFVCHIGNVSRFLLGLFGAGLLADSVLYFCPKLHALKTKLKLRPKQTGALCGDKNSDHAGDS